MGEDYFNDLLKRLETNSDVDPTVVEVDKKRYLRMLKEEKASIIAGRSTEEILSRFDNKIKDPRLTSKGKNVSKIIKEFLKIKCPINKAAQELNKFFKKYQINLAVDQKYFPISNNKVLKLNVIFQLPLEDNLNITQEWFLKLILNQIIKLRILLMVVDTIS